MENEIYNKGFQFGTQLATFVLILYLIGGATGWNLGRHYLQLELQASKTGIVLGRAMESAK